MQTILQAEKITFAITDNQFLIQKTYGKIEIIHPDLRFCTGCSLFEIFPELLGNQQDFEDILEGRLTSLKFEYYNHEIDGELHYLNMKVFPYIVIGGHITGILHLVQDVTTQGRLEQQVTQHRNQLQLLKEQIERQNLDLIAANTELSYVSDMKSRFISIAAHELRNPLTSLNGYIEILLDEQMGPLTQRQKDALRTVQLSGSHLTFLTDQLLNAARLEAGRIDLVLQRHDLVDLTQQVIREYTGQILTKNQTLTLSYHEELPQALCDETWTKQIVANLLSNASKFTPIKGHISVEIYPAENSGFLKLSVADTGIGILEDKNVDIFAPWFQSKRSSSDQETGSGLGLYITRSLVELHGGSIWYENQPEGGTIFHVTIPVAG